MAGTRPSTRPPCCRLFARAGEVDAASFEAEVGQVIRAAGAAGHPVRVYGEMVALLWDAGQLNAALEVEGLWNDLARDIPFGLYCGYPESAVSGADQRAALAEVCRLHGAVVGVPPAARPAPGASPVPGDAVLPAGPGLPPGGPALRPGTVAQLAARAALRGEPGQ